MDQILYYDVFASEQRPFDFRIVDTDRQTAASCHTWPNVDVAAIREKLRAKGWSAEDIDGFVRDHLSL